MSTLLNLDSNKIILGANSQKQVRSFSTLLSSKSGSVLSYFKFNNTDIIQLNYKITKTTFEVQY